MSDPIVYIDRSRIRPGSLEAVRGEIESVVPFIEREEPQLLHYAFHIEEATSTMTVVAVHPDARSVELHLDVGAQAFRRFADLIDLERIEVYGAPSDRVLELLDEKARDLGDGGTVTVVHPHRAFTRLDS